MDGGGEPCRLIEIGVRGLTPEQVGVWRICQSTGDGLVETGLHLEEALVGPGPGAEGAVCRVDVAGEQGCRVGVGAGYDEGRHPADVGGEPRRDQRPDMLGGGDEHLAAHVPAFLLRGKLVLEVHTGGPGLDERLGQLEDVERSAEPGFAVGHDGNHPVDGVVALGPVDLVGASQGVDDPPYQGRSGVRRVEALVGVHLVGQVGVARHLPAGQVDRLEPGFDHLHRLPSAHGAEGVDVVAGSEQLPQPLRHQSADGVVLDD